MKIATQFNIPIIPVSIKGCEKSLSKNKIFPRLTKVEIIFGEPLKFDVSNK